MKKKRKARDSDRAYAAELARCYWEHTPQNIELGGEKYSIRVDGDELARAMQCFAEWGTFEMPASVPAFERAQAFRSEVRYRHAELGMKVIDAIGKVAEMFDVSEQTVADAVYLRKKRKSGIADDAENPRGQVVLDPMTCRKITKS